MIRKYPRIIINGVHFTLNELYIIITCIDHREKTVTEISKIAGESTPYLSRILEGARKGGLVSSERRKGNGYIYIFDHDFIRQVNKIKNAITIVK